MGIFLGTLGKLKTPAPRSLKIGMHETLLLLKEGRIRSSGALRLISYVPGARGAGGATVEGRPSSRDMDLMRGY